MHFSEMLIDVLVFLAASIAVVMVFKRVKTSAILGYLAAGVIVGPAGLALVKESDSLHILAEFGVVFLLFMIGLEFSVSRLKSLLKYVVGLGGLQVVLTAAIICAVAMAFAIGSSPAVIIGGGLALSSTAFVLQLLSERGERDTPHGKIALAILLFQDLAIVPLLILLSVLAADTQTSFLASLGIAVGEAALSLGIVYVLGRVMLRPIYRSIALTGETDLFVGATLLLIIGIGLFLSLFGVSMALGGFLAGLLLAETEFRHQIEADIKPFKGILLGLFFMTVGMAIDLKLLVDNIGLIVGIVVALLVGKTLLIALLGRMFGLEGGTALRVGMLLSQGGEFGFVLFISAGSLGVIPEEHVQLLLTCIALSMGTTPFLATLGKKVESVLCNRKLGTGGFGDDIQEGSSGHAIIVGYGRVGQTVATLMHEMGLPIVAIDRDVKRVQSLQVDDNQIFYGDANQISVLMSMGIKNARCVVITIDEPHGANKIIQAIHQIVPDMKVFVRAKDVAHVRWLEKNISVKAVPEAIEGSLQLGTIVLKDFGIEDTVAVKIVNDHRENLYLNLDDYPDS
ncbi:potassium transporter TrkA [Kordiimonas sediminis]|uniref:Potassium transporter TrkA n=1 Tax=Kordiimonas sediminis TaxID=1735581 RepID=A0A919E8F2_9PROT|nr:monovalent cation:proton antiporter-2 (CPA2) family protein [Kordiimonas sediminis]GHF24983.1 potassium transporter TrkA [Kordiimonas sediminis]